MIEVRFILDKATQKKRTKVPEEPLPDEKSLMDVFAMMHRGEFPQPKPLKPEDYTAVYTWKHGEPNPFVVDKTKNKFDNPWVELVNSPMVVVKASGAELNLIRTHFQNIPWVINSRKQCEWVGEMAKFIALNFTF
jgi:hypothetical protein